MNASRPDKLSIVLFSGDYDRIHYALAMAAAAAAIGTPVTILFTMGACRALVIAGSDGIPAWRKLPTESGNDPKPAAGVANFPVANFPGAASAGAKDDGYGRQGIATFGELLSSCQAMGVRFIVCDMGLKAMGLEAKQLRPDLKWEIAGLVTFLNDASRDGSMVFV